MQTRILDQFGNPFVLNKQVQTENDSRLRWIKNTFSDHPSQALTPMKAAKLLLAAEQGDIGAQSALAEDMEEKDAHLFSELSKRRNAICEVDWQILPPPNASAAEQRDAQMLEDILHNAFWLDDLIFNATDALLKGYACQEIEWEPQRIDGLNLIKNINYRDATWFMTPPQERNQLRLRDGSAQGVELSRFGWITHIAHAKTGYLARIGLVRTLIFPYIYKNYSARDFAEFLEIYGLPLRLGKYPEGATEAEKNTLLKAVMSIGHNAGGIIPRGMEIEFQNAANGNADPFMTMIEWAEKTMSKAILGGTLTSQADGKTSTNALGNVHNDVRKEIRNADLKRLQATLNRDLIFPLYAFNAKSFTNANRLPRLQFDITENTDINQFAEGISKLVDIGFKIPAHWAHEQAQIPLPEDDEPILVRQLTAQPLSMLSAQLNDKLKAKEKSSIAILSASPDPDDKLDELEPSAEQYQAVIDPMLKPVVEALETGGYELAQQRIATLYADLDDKAFEQLLSRAIFVSEMWGRLNANR